MHRIRYTWLDVFTLNVVLQNTVLLTQHSYTFSRLLVVALLINHHHMLYTYLFIYFIEFYDAYCKRMRIQSNMKGYVFTGRLLIKTKF